MPASTCLGGSSPSRPRLPSRHPALMQDAVTVATDLPIGIVPLPTQTHGADMINLAPGQNIALPTGPAVLVIDGEPNRLLGDRIDIAIFLLGANGKALPGYA